MSDMESLNKQAIDNLKDRLERLERKVDEGFSHISAKLEIMIDGYVKTEELEKYVTVDAFRPTRAIAYTIVLTMGLAVLGAIIKLIIIPNA